eukprot:84357-Amphidinium_carterae.3
MLSAHLDKFRQAEKLLPENVQKLSVSERENIAEELITSGISLPAHTKGGLLSCVLKSWALIDRLKARCVHVDCRNCHRHGPLTCCLSSQGVACLQVLTLQEALSPFDTDDLPFNPKKPTLVASNLPDAQAAKLLQRLVISEGIISAICDPNKQVQPFLDATAYVCAEWSDEEAIASLQPLTKCAVTECLQVSSGLQALFGEKALPNEQAGGPNTAAAASRLMDARSGMLFIVKQVSKT